jgi:hypothetical protein
MSEITAGINKRRHSESGDENISTVKKTKHNEKMEVAELIILEKGNLASVSVETIDSPDINKKEIMIDSTTASENEANAVASSSDDQDDLLDRLDAIDSSGLRPPDLKLDELDTTDLEKDDLLKRLEEAESGSESEPVKIQISVDDEILINEDLLLDGEILSTQKEELEQPSSTNADSILIAEKTNDEPINVLTLDNLKLNADIDAESPVLIEDDDLVSDSTEAKEKSFDIHVSGSSKSEIFTVDSTDEQITNKSTGSLNEKLIDTVDSTNEKLISIISEEPSTSSLSSTTSYNDDSSKIMTETKVNPSEEENIEFTNHKQEVEVDTCVDSTNEENKPDVTNDISIAENTSEHENESFRIDSTHEANSTEILTEPIEIVVHSTNEIKSIEDIDMKTADSNLKPPDSSTVSEATIVNGKPQECDKNECKEAIISSGASITEKENAGEIPITPKDDVENSPNLKK